MFKVYKHITKVLGLQIAHLDNQLMYVITAFNPTVNNYLNMYAMLGAWVKT